MAGATGIQTRLAYIVETTPGTTPSTPAMSVVPFTQFNLGLTRDIFSDPSIQSSRQNHYLVYGNRKINGDIQTVMLANTGTLGNLHFDPWLESAVQGTWTSHVLKVGNTPKSFTIETTHQDATLAAPIYNRYTGCQVNQVQINVQMNAPVSMTWGFTGMTNSEATTLISGATYLPFNANVAPAVHGSVGSIFKEGGTTQTIITGINLTIAQGLDANFGLGSYDAISVTSSKIKVTGQLTAYFKDLVFLNKFLNGTATSIEFKVGDGNRFLNFNLPDVFYTGGSHPITNDNPVVLTLPFEAIYDTGAASTLVITRS